MLSEAKAVEIGGDDEPTAVTFEVAQMCFHGRSGVVIEVTNVDGHWLDIHMDPLDAKNLARQLKMQARGCSEVDPFA